MSRYRSEVHSLRARIRELRARLDERDRTEGVGPYATSLFGRLMYMAGRHLGKGIRASKKWLVRDAELATEAARMRAEVLDLERALAARPSPPLPRWEED
ncbi:hypothetical protein [Chondromyces crocatus]|nr:hypothetical protein [Chondromyces crocatus]